MKKIGFIDYYISEWHASNYPTWYKQIKEETGVDYQVAYVWAEQDVSPVDNVTTDEWCKTYGAERCATIAELCEKSDVIVILAPSDPDKHLAYAKEALTYGKRTFIDKTFASSYADGKEIYDVAAAHNTPFFSASSLRYAEEIQNLGSVESAIFTCGGGDFEEYIVHPLEMMLNVIADEAVKVKTEFLGDQRLCRVTFKNGTESAVIFSPGYNFGINAKMSDGSFYCKEVLSDMFYHMIKDMVNFFEGNDCAFDTMQTLEIMRIRDALLKSEAYDGEWISVER